MCSIKAIRKSVMRNKDSTIIQSDYILELIYSIYNEYNGDIVSRNEVLNRFLEVINSRVYSEIYGVIDDGAIDIDIVSIYIDIDAYPLPSIESRKYFIKLIDKIAKEIISIFESDDYYILASRDTLTSITIFRDNLLCYNIHSNTKNLPALNWMHDIYSCKEKNND